MLKAFKKLIFINIAALLMTGCAKPEKTYTLSVASEDTARGTVTGGGSFTFNSSVTVNATPEECYSFIGWFYDETKVSTEASYTFTMPANDYSLIAKFKLETLTYGLYPQNHVSDEELISKLNELTPSSANEAGYYSYNEELYCPCIASPDWEGIHFEDDVEIVKETKYWFKVESIKWRVLNEADGFVTSSRTLDMHQFDKRYDGKKTKTDYQGNTDEAYPNNYKYSEMRSWLNTEFYVNAFQNDTRIKVSEVDNSVTSTAFKENEYVCENTFDKIFLLSYQELLDASIGFSSHKSRQCKPTDYALARGARYDAEYDTGVYFTRSPDNSNGNLIFTTFRAGGVSYNEVNDHSGIRPALKLSIN